MASAFLSPEARRAVLNFARAILHGDKSHRDWLWRAAHDFIAGRPIEQQQKENKQARKVLVCGGRDYSDRRHIYEVLDLAHATNPIAWIIAGGANGADALASDWARKEQVKFQIFNADWETLGRKAGPIRNQKMLDEGKPELVIAFPGGRGTADMIRRAKAAGIRIEEIT